MMGRLVTRELVSEFGRVLFRPFGIPLIAEFWGKKDTWEKNLVSFN